MAETELLARVDTREGDDTVVLSPAVGWWSAMPRIGAIVGPGSQIGVLCHLRKRFRLMLPDGVSGRVIDGIPQQKILGVAYGQTLFRIVPLSLGESPEDPAKTLGGAAASTGIADGCWAVSAPTDGIFYHRQSPDAPPFVEVGKRISSGQTIGLIEVMKTFNQILYEGQGLPSEAEIVEIKCGDGAEVQAKATLIVVREV
jgi:acetyl-CoA carboxylase biotin carboxyl carrier protein